MRDPELDDALRLAAGKLQARSEAGRLRELALLGARSLGAQDTAAEQVRQGLRRLGATPARGDLLEVSRQLRNQVYEHERVEPLGETLEWVRGRPGVED